jgi:streptomycin 6-kinase
MPRALVESLELDRDDRRRDWAAGLPARVRDVAGRWRLTLGRPFQPGGVCSWVAPVRTADDRHLVLKVAYLLNESEHELEGLQLWAGDGTVLVHRAEKDDDTTYLLLERCAENHTLAGERAERQDEVVAGLLRRLWVEPPPGHPFRPLAQMCAEWADAYDEYPGEPSLDPALARAGVELFRTLPLEAPGARVLATDLHGENILAAEREPWLVIDPKPYVGDPAYDPLQHLLNHPDRLRADPVGLVHRMADLCGVERDRLRRWTFARCVVEWMWFGLEDVAVALAP